VDLIVHAGDVGTPEVLDTLQTIVKVHPVRGNVDGGKWTDKLPFTEVVQVGQVYLYVLHDLNALDLDPGSKSKTVSSFSIPEAPDPDGLSTRFPLLFCI